MEYQDKGYLVDCSKIMTTVDQRGELSISDEHFQLLCSPEYLIHLLQKEKTVIVKSAVCICVPDYKREHPEMEVYEFGIIGKRKKHSEHPKGIILGHMK